MKFLLVGRGRMGREVARLARAAGHDVVAELGRASALGDGPVPPELRDADVAVDFSSADAVPRSVRSLAEAGLAVVVGTTGWYERLDEVRRVVTSSGTGLVYGANFSIGANVLMALVAQAGRLFETFAEYDPYVFEHHHRQKLDAPSGTAQRLADLLLEALSRKECIDTGASSSPIDERALSVASVRAGSAFGRHVVGFDSPTDSLEIVHTARSREGFARGALYAAERIRGKQGVFEFREVLEGRLS